MKRKSIKLCAHSGFPSWAHDSMLHLKTTTMVSNSKLTAREIFLHEQVENINHSTLQNAIGRQMWAER